MKTILIPALALALFCAGCNSATAPSATADETALPCEALPFDADLLLDDELNEEEIAALVFMREEEKLARDVYLTSFEQHGLRVFSNIASSEQTHTDAVLAYLNLYGIEDPVGENPQGVFTDPELQELHDNLVAQSAESLESALLVGGLIEEVDIRDLEDGLAVLEHEDIQAMFIRLESASGNHLRAFVRNYENQTGNTYVPQLLSPEAYAAIIDAGGSGNGGGNGGRRGVGRGRR